MKRITIFTYFFIALLSNQVEAKGVVKSITLPLTNISIVNSVTLDYSCTADGKSKEGKLMSLINGPKVSVTYINLDADSSILLMPINGKTKIFVSMTDSDGKLKYAASEYSWITLGHRAIFEDSKENKNKLVCKQIV